MTRWVVLLVAGICLLMLTGTFWLSSLNGSLTPELGDASLMLAFYGYLLIGLLLVSRRPRNVIGWILAGVGLLTNLGALTEEYAVYALVTNPGTPGGVAAAWFQSWWWLLIIAAIFVFVPLLFPTGRPISSSWRWATRTAVAGIVAGCAVSAMTPVLEDREGAYRVDNPLGASWGSAEEGLLAIAFAVLFATIILAALASVILRFRGSAGGQRQQLKIFLYAVAVTVVLSFAEDFGILPGLTGSDVFFSFVIVLPPSAIALAVLRYRLYDIDRLISRTLTYAVLTAMLVGLYLAAVTGLTALTAPVTGDSPLAVAAATLLAAAAFGPARRRIQEWVDRRFNRGRYDAAQAVESYRTTLREEVEIEALRDELLAAVHTTVQPARSSLWLREAS